MYFQDFLKDTNLMERNLPLSFSLAPVSVLKLMKGQRKSSCLSAERLFRQGTEP